MTTTTQKLQKSQHLGHIAIILTKKHPFPISLTPPSWNHFFHYTQGFFTLKIKTQQAIMNYSMKQTPVLNKFIFFIERIPFNKKTNLLHVSYSQLLCGPRIFFPCFFVVVESFSSLF